MQSSSWKPLAPEPQRTDVPRRPGSDGAIRLRHLGVAGGLRRLRADADPHPHRTRRLAGSTGGGPTSQCAERLDPERRRTTCRLVFRRSCMRWGAFPTRPTSCPRTVMRSSRRLRERGCRLAGRWLIIGTGPRRIVVARVLGPRPNSHPGLGWARRRIGVSSSCDQRAELGCAVGAHVRVVELAGPNPGTGRGAHPGEEPPARGEQLLCGQVHRPARERRHRPAGRVVPRIRGSVSLPRPLAGDRIAERLVGPTSGNWTSTTSLTPSVGASRP